MKLIVDKIPEKPEDCLFSVDCKKGDKYSCEFSHAPCKYYEEGWHKECPYLQQETIGSYYSIATNPNNWTTTSSLSTITTKE